MYKGFHHIGVRTVNTDVSLKFYTEVLGGKHIYTADKGGAGNDIHFVEMAPGAVVEIIPNGTTEPQENARWAHIALLVDDVEAVYNSAVSKGAVEKVKPQHIMLGTIAAMNAFVLGPDGEDVEFFSQETPF